MTVSVRRNLLVSIDPTSGVPALNQSILAPASLPIGVALGTAGYNNSVKLIPKGGVAPFSWSILSGSLPTGLSLNATTGDITGTPSAQGSFAFIIQIADSALQTTPASYVLNVSSGLFRLACTPTPAVKSQPYRYQVLMADATGSTSGITYTVVAGALPAGIALSSAGVLSSVNVTAAVGTFYFTVRGTKGSATLDVPMQLAVNAQIASLAVSVAIDDALNNMTVGVPVDAYVKLVSSSAIGRGPFTWAVTSGALPAGVVMDSTGHFTGTPTAATSSSYAQPTITVTDRMGSARNFTPASSAVGFKVNSTLTAATPGQIFRSDPNGLPVTTDLIAPYFGDGSDGDITINASSNPAVAPLSGGVNSLQRDLYAHNLTITGSGILDTVGFDIYVSGVLDISAAGVSGIRADYFWGTGIGSGGAGGVTNGVAGGNSTGLAYGDGGVGGGTTSTGKGGNGSSGTGANGGTAGSITTKARQRSIVPNDLAVDSISHSVAPIGGGTGGGGGGGGAGNGSIAGGNAGGGGKGRGRIRIFARKINRSASTAAAAIDARGDAGSNGTAGSGAGRGGGAGGGGGGGGKIRIVFGELAGTAATNVIDASGGKGGNGGTGGGSGGTAGAGNTGGDGGSIALNDLLTPSTTVTVGSAGSANSGTTGGNGGACTANL